MFADLPEVDPGKKRTMKELAAYFEVPYSDVHRALRDLRSRSRHNERFSTEVTRNLLLVHYRMALARARLRMKEIEGKIRSVELAAEPENAKRCETCRHYLGGGYDNCRINLESECAAGCFEAWEPKESDDGRESDVQSH